MKFISYEKMSKKQRREVDHAARKDWHGVDPRTKVVISKKAYKRVKQDWANSDLY